MARREAALHAQSTEATGRAQDAERQAMLNETARYALILTPKS